jgi:hypothetical protein
MRAEERAKIIEDNRLCAFCLLLDRAIACRAKEDKNKTACVVPECEGRHAMRLHELLKDIYGERSRVHLVQGDDGWEDPEGAWVVDGVEEEDETMFVNTVQQEGSSWRELDDLWPELNGGECREVVGGVYCIWACRREGGHAPGTEEGQPHETLYLSEEEGALEAGWWSSKPMELQPDEGETEYLISLLMGGSSAEKDEPKPARTPAALNAQSRRTGGEGAAEEVNRPRGETQGDESSMGTESKKGPPKGQGVHDKKAPKEKLPGATQGLKLETDAQGIVGDP